MDDLWVGDDELTIWKDSSAEYVRGYGDNSIFYRSAMTSNIETGFLHLRTTNVRWARVPAGMVLET